MHQKAKAKELIINRQAAILDFVILYSVSEERKVKLDLKPISFQNDRGLKTCLVEPSLQENIDGQKLNVHSQVLLLNLHDFLNSSKQELNQVCLFEYRDFSTDMKSLKE